MFWVHLLTCTYIVYIFINYTEFVLFISVFYCNNNKQMLGYSMYKTNIKCSTYITYYRSMVRNVLRCAVTFRETHANVVPGNTLQLHITTPNDFCYFKRSYNSNTTKTNKTLAKYIHIVSNGIKTTDLVHVLQHNYVYYVRKALFLPLSLPYILPYVWQP